MSLDLTSVRVDYPMLDTQPQSRDRGAVAYRLILPPLCEGRAIAWAELVLPQGFPDSEQAKIFLSPETVLQIPHIEEDGKLCTEGDPGPGRGLSPEDRIRGLLYAYNYDFLKPWIDGTLEKDFAKEARNYWLIEVARRRSSRDPVTQLFTVDPRPRTATIREGLLMLPGRIVIAASDDYPMVPRLIQSLGFRATQRVRVRIADIPISHPLTPLTWPKSLHELAELLEMRLGAEQYAEFQRLLRARSSGIHRIALLRSLTCSFAFVLPGGPATVIQEGKVKKGYLRNQRMA